MTTMAISLTVLGRPAGRSGRRPYPGMSPGGYRFGDYWTLGLPLLVLFVAVATLPVPVFWRF